MKLSEISSGKKVSTFLKLALAFGLLFWLYSSGAIKLEYLRVTSGGGADLAAGAFLAFVAVLLGAVRFWILLDGAGAPVTALQALKINAITYFFTQCVLGSASGDAARFFYTLRATGKGSRVGAAIVMDRVIGVSGLLLLSALGLLLNFDLVEHSNVLQSVSISLAGLISLIWLSLILGYISLTVNRIKALLTLTLIMAVMFIIYWLGDSLWIKEVMPLIILCCALSSIPALLAPAFCAGKKFSVLLRGVGVIGGRISDFIEGILLYARSWKSVLATVVVTAFQHILLILSLYLFSLALNVPAGPDPGQMFFAAPLTFLAGLIPAPAAGLGVNETALDFLLKLASGGLVTAGASIYLMQRVWITVFSLSGFYVMMRKNKLVTDS